MLGSPNRLIASLAAVALAICSIVLLYRVCRALGMIDWIPL